jgi:hypothetical protein
MRFNVSLKKVTVSTRSNSIRSKKRTNNKIMRSGMKDKKSDRKAKRDTEIQRPETFISIYSFRNHQYRAFQYISHV